MTLLPTFRAHLVLDATPTWDAARAAHLQPVHPDGDLR